jgi:putative lipoic acid-binding regulatory protein
MTDTLLQFPCDFPLKVMGRDTPEFRQAVRGIVQRHMGEIDVAKIEERNSRDGNYLGVTYIVHVTSKEQLDELYRELSGHPLAIMVL